MYGKIFTSMFEGSLYGKGAVIMAVWAYVIAHQRPDKSVGTQVELNPKKLADSIGEDQDKIAGAIKFLCSPDSESRTPDCEGRRLVQLSRYDYKVVNGEKYRQIRNEEERREQNRLAKRRERAKKGMPLMGEQEYESALRNGATEDEANSIITKHLPASRQ